MKELSFPSAPPRIFLIVILGMNRFDSMRRLLRSLFAANYGSDTVNLTIRFDRPGSGNFSAWIEDIEEIKKLVDSWSHGHSSILICDENQGLRKSWLEAWKPNSSGERAIILEDDIEVSPLWYEWIQAAHDSYQHRADLAGVSLQRQTLVPLFGFGGNSISDNNGRPFLYRLVGSIGFSPKASVWSDFLDFAECAIATNLDVSVPNIITSEWYRGEGKRGMWTQLFIYFCYHLDISTLYYFPPNNKALAAHWREKGVHFERSQGVDFELMLTNHKEFEFPAELVSLGWDARPITKKSSIRTLVMSVAIGYNETYYNRFVLGLRKHYNGAIALLISASAPRSVRQMLQRNRVITVESEENGGNRLSENWKRILKIRYRFYESLCDEKHVDWCMMIDFRDVLFQGDPFKNFGSPNGPTLHVFLHNIKSNTWVDEEVPNCIGGNRSSLEGQWMINAGAIVATPSSVSNLVEMNEHFGVRCDDQIALNLAVYGEKLKKTHVVTHKQGEGNVNNVAYGGNFRMDSQHRYLNHDCFPAPVVHQFDVVELEKQKKESKARAQFNAGINF